MEQVLVNILSDISKLNFAELNYIYEMSFERIIGLLLQYNLGKIDSLLGDIHRYCPWCTPIEQIYYLKHLPIIKVWTGR